MHSITRHPASYCSANWRHILRIVSVPATQSRMTDCPNMSWRSASELFPVPGSPEKTISLILAPLVLLTYRNTRMAVSCFCSECLVIKEDTILYAYCWMGITAWVGVGFVIACYFLGAGYIRRDSSL